MQAFSIARLDTEIGLIRAKGVWDPITKRIEFDELERQNGDAWQDVTFWISEQEHEEALAAIVRAAILYLD